MLCLFVILGAALANSPARESRQTQIELTDGLVWMDDELENSRTMFNEDPVGLTMTSTRNGSPPSTVSTDQKPEEQRFPYGGGGRPYGYGYGFGYGFGRPYGYGRPWGPYGRPWGPYTPYRPWGPF